MFSKCRPTCWQLPEWCRMTSTRLSNRWVSCPSMWLHASSCLWDVSLNQWMKRRSQWAETCWRLVSYASTGRPTLTHLQEDAVRWWYFSSSSVKTLKYEKASRQIRSLIILGEEEQVQSEISCCCSHPSITTGVCIWAGLIIKPWKMFYW